MYTVNNNLVGVNELQLSGITLNRPNY
jgi:hypothetical protein